MSNGCIRVDGSRALAGRSTAVGTPHFAGRRVIPPAADDTAAESSYLFEECSEQIHIATRGAPPHR